MTNGELNKTVQVNPDELESDATIAMIPATQPIADPDVASTFPFSNSAALDIADDQPSDIPPEHHDYQTFAGLEKLPESQDSTELESATDLENLPSDLLSEETRPMLETDGFTDASLPLLINDVDSSVEHLKQELSKESNLLQSEIPIFRVKRIMKADPLLSNTTDASVRLVALATEQFIQSLVSSSIQFTQKSKRKTVVRADIAQAIGQIPQYAFLKGAFYYFG